jgi:adenylate cyclase
VAGLRRPGPFRLHTIHIGIAASLVAALAVFWNPQTFLEGPREWFFDQLTQIVPAPAMDEVLVVDIDRASLPSNGEPGWQRGQTAQLLEKIASGNPRVIAIDLVFSNQCDPALPGNVALANALSKAPAVLGFLISQDATTLPYPRPTLAYQREMQVPDLWFIDGAEHSCTLFQDQARSSAASFLVGDSDSRVRRIQAFSILNRFAYPALAVEAARFSLGKDVQTIVSGKPPKLKLADHIYSLSEDGSLRFSAGNAAIMARRTLSADDILKGKIPPARFGGKTVFVGSSLPNLGGLRSSAAMPLVPSVQIHADLAAGLISDSIPVREGEFKRYEALFVLLAGLMMARVASRWRPLAIAGFGAFMMILSFALAIILYATTRFLADGITIAIALGFILAVTSYTQFSHVRRMESVARQRFGQYLPRSVVARYLDNPDMLRMEGEERQVTALFTDIEDFSPLSRNVGPQVLIRLLDVYFAEVTRLVADHGGMVDKIVGDAVHAFFNAPEDLPDHVNRAVLCAVAIRNLTQDLCKQSPFAEHGFGRTRIGIETGTVIFGEVGSGGKLDFTAHGDAINLAARLQEANKALGTHICIGPAAATQAGLPLDSLGEHDIRGFGTMKLFTLPG